MSSCEGSDPFALQVLGDSMAPEFPEGSIVVAEPDGVIESGRYVIAMHNNEYIFRQLVMEGERQLLKPLNEAYPVLEMGPEDSIRAVVVQKANRRDRKRYY
ncbi:S24 family peptidase [Thioalbus denitrificans]|uniref:Peptidase S24-like protein n=1 Tax=Thioalbus denitrificans TaxID=547122 RepID=A0A369BX72_9GAMM|nr:S24 family peptidase [Thioalbus denitrificans]RCX26292.1 peptidase S24-like protein [Thioalbus denitrificans]